MSPGKSRVPTQKQFGLLLRIGSGNAWLSAGKRDTEALLRRGWVTAEWKPPYYQWVRITADGLRALGDGVDKYGLPEMTHGHRTQKVCVECEREWRPKCRCGSRMFRYQTEEVTR